MIASLRNMGANGKRNLGRCVAFLGLALLSQASLGCSVHWQLNGDTEIFRRLQNSIGSHFTDEWCQKYNKKYELIIVADNFHSDTETLGYATVAIRPRGSDSLPFARHAAYYHEPGNYVIGESYDLAVKVTLEALDNVMSALPNYVPH